MTLFSLSLLLLVFITAVISGVLSLGGGTILMGVFGWVLPVSVAMILHGVIQFTTNVTRFYLYYQHVHWKVLRGYLLGTAICVATFAWAAFVPDKAVLFIVLGISPFLHFVLPKNLSLDITKRGAASSCGVIVTAFLLSAGVSGSMLDLYYTKAPLTRYQVHATKALTQMFGHLIKIGYFIAVLGPTNPELGLLPIWVYVAVIPPAFLGTRLARQVLVKISDHQFRSWTQAVTMLVGAVFLIRGLMFLISTEA